MSASWDISPDKARLRWHAGARERDEARLAEGPDDDSESPESPWARPEPFGSAST